jgi:hypothetical protein
MELILLAYINLKEILILLKVKLLFHAVFMHHLFAERITLSLLRLINLGHLQEATHLNILVYLGLLKDHLEILTGVREL